MLRQNEESPLVPVSPTPLFLEKFFHPDPFCQIRLS